MLIKSLLLSLELFYLPRFVYFCNPAIEIEGDGNDLSISTLATEPIVLCLLSAGYGFTCDC